MQLGAAHLAVMTNAELVALGMEPHRVTAQRERMSGHTRRIAKPYGASIGWWGGVAPLAAIAEHLDLDVETVRNFAKSRALRWQTRTRIYTPVQLAVRCLASEGPSRDAADALGVLPVEVVLYRSAVTELLVEEGATFAELISWSPARLETEWRRHALRIETPRIEKPGLRDAGFLRGIVAAAEKLVEAGGLEDE